MKSAVQTIEDIQALLKGPFPHVEPDGDIGKITRGALRALGEHPAAQEMRRDIQELLAPLFPQVRPDTFFGPITFSALALLDEMGDHESLAEMIEAGELPETAPADFQIVIASSFADPADIAGFRRCKKTGKSDVQCFAVGDNGIGAWGADTTANRPMVALPREIWRLAGKRGGAPVEVRAPDGRQFFATLEDTMPSLKNIKNGAGMDCNPFACRLLEKDPPMMIKGVGWRWALS